MTITNREWRRENPDRVKRHDRRKTLKRRYGLTENQYDSLLDAQGGQCALCVRLGPAQSSSERRNLDVDHDHATGEIRGILCGHHNRMLGNVGDSVDAVRAYLDYLLSPPSRGVI